MLRATLDPFRAFISHLPRLAGLGGALVAASVASAQDVIHVDNSSDVNGNGTSWTSPFIYLQDALAVAGAGDEIRIAGGVYRPDLDSSLLNIGDPSVTFLLDADYTLAGGYAGSANPGNPNLRNIALYVTTLSGDLDADDGPNFANYDDNSYHVVTVSGGDPTVDGVTIRSGHADPNDESPPSVGAGAMVLDAGPLFLDCRVLANWTVADPNQTFTGGGGAYNFEGTPMFIGCRFDDNLTDGVGGGLYSVEGSLYLLECVFEGNQAQSGAGLFSQFDAATSTIRRCAFIGNDGGVGGGMAALNARWQVDNCLIADNTAGHGGGIVTDASDTYPPQFRNCTIANNIASGSAGGLSSSFSNDQIVACILYGNQDFSGSGLYPQILVEFGDPSVTWSCVAGISPGNGNISDDPEFVGPDDGDYHLADGSPCIDAGDPNYTAPSGILDLDGRVRVWPGETGDPAVVDMGAYEFGAPLP